MKNFQNRVAVITGGASGFGREFANIGAGLGMKLVLADVQQDGLDKARAELEAQGAQVLAMRCDVRKAEEVQALADATMAKFGAVHLVFNNAGVGCRRPGMGKHASRLGVGVGRQPVGRDSWRTHLHEADAGMRKGRRRATKAISSIPRRWRVC